MTTELFLDKYVLTSDRPAGYEADPTWPPETDQCLWRFIRFDQLMDILTNRQIWLSVPSELGQIDPLDGMPDMGLALADAGRLFGPIPRGDECLAVTHARNAVKISCWTCGGETYAMWKAYGDLEWGICLCVSVDDAIGWARAQDLDRGPVQYVRTVCPPNEVQKSVDLAAPADLFEVMEKTFSLPTPFARAPLQWFKSQFFHTEFEYRFGKRMSRNDSSTAWANRHRWRFDPQPVPFEPAELLQNGAIITGPRAQKWYTDFVRTTVRAHVNGVSVKPSEGASSCDQS